MRTKRSLRGSSWANRTSTTSKTSFYTTNVTRNSRYRICTKPLRIKLQVNRNSNKLPREGASYQNLPSRTNWITFTQRDNHSCPTCLKRILTKTGQSSSFVSRQTVPYPHSNQHSAKSKGQSRRNIQAIISSIRNQGTTRGINCANGTVMHLKLKRKRLM